MSTGKPICRHCHRLRPTNAAGYCGGCATNLRAQEQRRPAGDPVVVAALTPSLAPPDEPIDVAARLAGKALEAELNDHRNPMREAAEAIVSAAPAPPAAVPVQPPDLPPPAVPLSPAVVPAFVLPNIEDDATA